MNSILTMSSIIFPLITFRYASNILMPGGMGKVSFAVSLITYFNVFAQLGIPIYGIRICAMVRDNKEELTRTAHELLVLNFIVGAVSYFVLLLAILFVPKLQEDRALYIIVSSTIFLSAIGMEWLYKALEQYTYIAIRSIIFKLIAMVGMFLLIHTESDYVLYAGITVFASSAANIINLFHARKYIGFRPVGYYSLHRHLKPVLIFFAMSCATTIYTNLDNVMLGIMATKTQVGYYDAAVKVKVVLVSLVTSLGTVLLPRASYYVEMEMKGEFRRISAKALNFVMLVALPLMIFFMLFAEQSIRFLTGGTLYESATLPMQIIMPTLLFIGITNVLGIQILYRLGVKRRCSFPNRRCCYRSNIKCDFNSAVRRVRRGYRYACRRVFQCSRQYVAAFRVLPVFLDIHYFKIFAALIPAVLSAVWVDHLRSAHLVAGLPSNTVWPLRHQISGLLPSKRTARKKLCSGYFQNLKENKGGMIEAFIIRKARYRLCRVFVPSPIAPNARCQYALPPCCEEVVDISAPVAIKRIFFSSPRSTRFKICPHNTPAEHPQPEPPACTSCASRSNKISRVRGLRRTILFSLAAVRIIFVPTAPRSPV